MSEEVWGKVAYDAYRERMRDKLPKYEKLNETEKKRWTAVAVAIRAVMVRKAFKIRA